MGCCKSKKIKPEETGEKTINDVLTDAEKITVSKSWRKYMAQNLVDTGILVLSTIFRRSAVVKKLFGLAEVDQEDLPNNPLFRGHATRFMYAIRAIVEQLKLSQGQNDSSTDKVKQKTNGSINTDVTPVHKQFQKLGKQHLRVVGMKRAYFNEFVLSIDEVWQTVLKENYTDDVKECWSKIFQFIIDNMEKGMDDG